MRVSVPASQKVSQLLSGRARRGRYRLSNGPAMDCPRGQKKIFGQPIGNDVLDPSMPVTGASRWSRTLCKFFFNFNYYTRSKGLLRGHFVLLTVRAKARK